MSPTTKVIVQSYLRMTRLTLEEFGEQFGVGRQTMIDWGSGNAAPDTELMLKFRDYSDWRGAFAKEILATRQPGQS